MCGIGPEPCWRLANSGPARRAPICSRSSWARSRRIGTSRRLPPLPLADRDHALGEADVLDPELDQLGGPGAGLQQGLQHQPGPAALGIGLVEEAQLLLDRQPVDAAAPLGRGAQAGSLPGRL